MPCSRWSCRHRHARRWHGSTEAYTGREVQDIPGVLAVFAERRKDSFGPYVRLMSVTLN
ncbi:TPA: DUF987 domain-containing protein [Escherichia coli]|nr:DUF987 domain-containing protein [Escherichia coli]